MPGSFWGTRLAASQSSWNELRKSQVLDEKGRARFHGAFEGGFEEDWSASAQPSWHSTRARHERQCVHDYMDDEDVVFMAQRLTTQPAFQDPFNKRAVRAAAWGASADEIPAEFVASFMANSSFASKLLEKCTRNAQHALSNSSTAAARSFPMRGRHAHGLGFVSENAWQQRGQESATVKAWKRQRNHAEEEEALSFHVVEVVDEEEEAVKRPSVKSKVESESVQHQYWPDGSRIPAAFQLAKKLPRYVAKNTTTTPLPRDGKIHSAHEFGPGQHAPRYKRQSRWDVITSYKSMAQKPETAKTLLAARFAPLGSASRQEATAPKSNTIGEFTQTSFEWTPLEATRSLFGLPAAAAVAVVVAESDVIPREQKRKQQRAQMADFKAVLETKQAYESILSSEDSQVEEEEEKVEEETEKKHKHKKKKHKHKHKHKKNKKKRKRARSSSSSSSSSSTS